MKQRTTYLMIAIVNIGISVWLVTLMGCAGDIAYRKSCWEIALGAAAGARYELGLDKKHIRVGIDDSAVWQDTTDYVGHAWTEVYVKGEWHRISDKGPWYTTSTWQDKWKPDRYYTFDQAFDRAKRFKPRSKRRKQP